VNSMTDPSGVQHGLDGGDGLGHSCCREAPAGWGQAAASCLVSQTCTAASADRGTM
jgi:hypothetical protein